MQCTESPRTNCAAYYESYFLTSNKRFCSTKKRSVFIWVGSAVGLFDAALILDLWGENKKDTLEKNVYYVGKVLILI